MTTKNASDSVTSASLSGQGLASPWRHIGAAQHDYRLTRTILARGKKLKSVAEAAV
jgi:hypothetical protein